MNPYENVSTNPRGTNGSAFDLMSQIGSQAGFQNTGQQGNPAMQPNFWPQNVPYFAPFTFNPQQIPYQQQFNPHFNLQPQGFSGSQQPPWQAFQQGQMGSFAGQQGIAPPWGQQGVQTQPFQQHLPVLTTRAIELNVNLPIQRVIGRHPQEIQQYVLNVVLPVLLEGLIRRAIAPEVGHTVSTDLRECVVRIEI